MGKTQSVPVGGGGHLQGSYAYNSLTSAAYYIDSPLALLFDPELIQMSIDAGSLKIKVVMP